MLSSVLSDLVFKMIRIKYFKNFFYFSMNITFIIIIINVRIK